MALARRGGISSVGRPEWEVDYSGLAVQRQETGDWKVRPYVRGTCSYAEISDYIERHALREARFSSRARAVDAVRLALDCESLTRPRPRTVWQREGEGVYRSTNGRWRLDRGETLNRLTLLSPAAQGLLDALPEFKKMLEIDAGWNLDCCGEWADWLESRLAI